MPLRACGLDAGQRVAPTTAARIRPRAAQLLPCGRPTLHALRLPGIRVQLATIVSCVRWVGVGSLLLSFMFSRFAVCRCAICINAAGKLRPKTARETSQAAHEKA